MAFPNPNQSPIYAITPNQGVANLNAATAGALGVNTNAVTVYTSPSGAGNVGSRITSLIATSTDTAAVNLFIQIQSSGGAIRPIAQVNVPIQSGNLASTPAVDCFNPTVAVGLPIDNTGKRYIDMVPGDILIVSTVASMTAAKHCYVTAIGADYQ